MTPIPAKSWIAKLWLGFLLRPIMMEPSPQMEALNKCREKIFVTFVFPRIITKNAKGHKAIEIKIPDIANGLRCMG